MPIVDSIIFALDFKKKMKKLLKIVFAGSFALMLASCTSQSTVPSAKVEALLQAGEFTFMAERANPMGNDVVNILNSLPNTSSSQMLNLDYGYTLQIKKDEVKAELPYFGRMYTANMDPSKNSYRFTSKDFTFTENDGKNGSLMYNIVTKDLSNNAQLSLQVFKSGKAYLSVSSNDRQPISYDGYIKENLVVKK